MNEFLDEVHQEEAGADDELGEGVVRPHREDVAGEGVGEVLPRLRQHVGEDGGQEDPAAEAQEAADDPLPLLARVVDVLLEAEGEEAEEQGEDPHEGEGDDLRGEELHLEGRRGGGRGVWVRGGGRVSERGRGGEEGFLRREYERNTLFYISFSQLRHLVH